MSTLNAIGNTPLIELEKNIFGKCEFLNPTGSVKDRAALYIIQDGIKSGKIKENTNIIEPTSGNTGIALAAICAKLGLKLTLTMPESMSVERRKLMSVYGANLVLTPASEGMKGSIEKAFELAKENGFVPNQFENFSNVKAHKETTANEILKQLGDVDILVSAVGTGGTISGIGEVLKKHNKNIKIIAVEPKQSNVLSGGNASPHKIQGIGAGFIPKILNLNIIDEVVTIDDEKALEYTKKLPKEKGLFVGISSSANILASKQISKKYPNKKIVTILCDNGNRYLSLF